MKIMNSSVIKPKKIFNKNKIETPKKFSIHKVIRLRSKASSSENKSDDDSENKLKVVFKPQSKHTKLHGL